MSYLGYNELGEEKNKNLGAFIWKPNNLFLNLLPVEEKDFGVERHVLRTPRVGAAGYMWM